MKTPFKITLTLKRYESKKKKSSIKYDHTSFKNTHALLKSEFDKLFFHNFENKDLDLVRDLFILQSWLGGLENVVFLI